MGKPQQYNRRGFIKTSAIGATLAFGYEDKVLQARENNPLPSPSTSQQSDFPKGKIKGLEISRLICGGNLISGFAHSRDLIYVSSLLKNYFSDEKVCETLDLCEQQGVNTAILRLDDHCIRILDKYRNDWGGNIQWICQAKITEDDITSEIDRAIDSGAVACYVHGGVGDRFVQENKVEIVGEAVAHIKKHGVVSGVAGHSLETIKAYEEAGIDPDFYMKTINAKNYWSAGPMPRNDSVWAETPEETIAFMKSIQKPWIGYKVLGAGAIHPKEGFQYAYENGADFICAGMFDFQVTENVIIAKRILSQDLKRERPWCA